MAQTKTVLNITEERTSKLAVLIDADNASAKDIKNILDELTKYGEATVKRIYGNFVNQNGNWKQAINDLAIKPMQQFAYTTGKNATDGFMIRPLAKVNLRASNSPFQQLNSFLDQSVSVYFYSVLLISENV